MNELVKAAKQMHAMIDEAYGELLADGHRDGPRCLLLTNLEIALEAGRQAIAQAEADHIRDATKKVAEPVAWLYDWEHEGEIVTGWVTQDFETTKFNNGHNVRPLYAAPQPPNANIRSASEYSEQEPIGYVIQDDNYDGSKIRAEPVSGCCLPVYLAAPPQPNEERQEPVATLYRYVKDNMEPMTEWKACAEWPMIESRGLEIIPLYTAQPQREWIEPSDEQIAKINGFYSQASFETIAHAALALAKELNHG